MRSIVMARRVHELAKEWNIETKELVARLDKLGITGKRSQSSLSDEEVERVSRELAAEEKPGVTIGQERVVTGVTGERLVECRVGTKVIRRRASAPDPSQRPIEAIEMIEPISLGLEPLEVFEGPESLLGSVDTPVLPTLPELPDMLLPLLGPAPIIGAPPVVEALPERPETGEPDEMVGEDVLDRELSPPELEMELIDVSAVPVKSPVVEKAPVAVPKTAPGVGAERPLGPRILGRIDLKKAEADRTAALERSAAADAARGRRMPAEVPPQPVEPGRPVAPKRKKRRVIQKPEFTEVAAHESRMGRVPRKKRVFSGKEQKKTEITTPKASKRVVRVSEVISVGDLAKAMGIKAAAVVKKLIESGMMATVNQVLDADTAVLMAAEFGYNVENIGINIESAVEVGHKTVSEESLQPRPPVITIMGHVDHGKTSILDAIRETNVTSGEAGGITQHIGAYSVKVHDRYVTFLDTPGHEAFTAMRARGAKVTDIVTLVVAADDGVMPQTVEAINHARAAEVPILVALNKIDKPEANLDRIKQELADHGLLPEEWGGQTICVPVSAKTREGLPQLLEMLLLQAEVLELKANPDKPARGTIVEAKLDRGRGPVATVLVQEGTLHVGDAFVCGRHYGRVRAMINDAGEKEVTALPSRPVEILGLSAVPEAGIPFVVVGDEATARQVAEYRQTKQREATLVKTAKISLDDLYRQIQAGDTKELRVVIKADVHGSVEALSEALSRLSTDEVRLNVLHTSVGGITESDVMLATASNAIVVGFNVRPEAKANAAAEREGVELRLYTVIYDAVNEVRDAMEGLLEPTFREKLVGRAEVRDIFSLPGGAAVAGCMVTEGAIRRNASARLVRDHVVVYQGKVGSLRRFKDDAREVQTGYECGVGLEAFQNIKRGDVIETYEMEEVARRLSVAAGRQPAAERTM
jgi:translation initiation factor IF-2